MKSYLIITFLLLSAPIDIKACNLRPYLKIELFEKTPYRLDDIVCSKNGRTYTYYIRGGVTSKNYKRNFVLKTLNKAGIVVDNLTIDNKGNYRWTISNDRYLHSKTQIANNPKRKKRIKKHKKKARKIASIENQKNDIKPKIKEEKKPNKKRSPFPISSIEKVVFFDQSYGVNYLSIDQAGSLGNASIGNIVPHKLEFNTGINRGELKFYGGFSFIDLKVSSNSTLLSESLFNYSLGLSYHGLDSAIENDQHPLLRNNNGTIELNKIGITSIYLGYQSKHHLNTKPETVIDYSLKGGFPLKINSSASETKVSNISGYKIKANIRVKREIKKSKNKMWSCFFKQSINYSDYEFNTTWDSSSGSVTKKVLDSSFQIGISIDF